MTIGYAKDDHTPMRLILSSWQPLTLFPARFRLACYRFDDELRRVTMLNTPADYLYFPIKTLFASELCRSEHQFAAEFWTTSLCTICLSSWLHRSSDIYILQHISSQKFILSPIYQPFDNALLSGECCSFFINYIHVIKPTLTELVSKHSVTLTRYSAGVPYASWNPRHLN